MNLVFAAFILVSFAAAIWHQAAGDGGAMTVLSAAALSAAEAALPLAFSLVGVMALFLGVMKIAEAAGLLGGLARLLTPLLRRLFPELPSGHPALGAMAMNIAANLLGLGNAATPFGVRAMEELEGLNRHKGIASNPQVLFLAINTAGLTLLPTKVIALRASMGAADPAAVVGPTLIATLVAALVAVAAARLLQRVTPPFFESEMAASPPSPALGWHGGLALAAALGLVALVLLGGHAIGPWLVPGLIALMIGVGLARRVPVYEAFVEGAREGFTVAVRIIPYLIAILVAVGMLRASGALDAALAPLGQLLAPVGVPAEALALAVVRSLSGSGAYGMLAASLQNPATGPDTPTGILLGTIYASTETTFYVLAVYFGAIGTKRIRHALAAGLIADAAGLVAAVVACRVLAP